MAHSLKDLIMFKEEIMTKQVPFIEQESLKEVVVALLSEDYKVIEHRLDEEMGIACASVQLTLPNGYELNIKKRGPRI